METAIEIFKYSDLGSACLISTLKTSHLSFKNVKFQVKINNQKLNFHQKNGCFSLNF